MITTRFTRLVGCRLPVQLAPMGGVCTPELVGAVTAGGAMGMVGLGNTPAPGVAPLLDAVDAAARGPYGVNILVPFLDLDVLDAVAERVAMVDLYHAPPDPALVARAARHGASVAWQVGTVTDALAAADAGVDLVVLRGIEGGGRLHGGHGLWPLLFEVLDRVEGVPVLAAGGIATGRGLAAALAAGADGVRVGTAFVATHESGAHPRYKEALVEATAADSVVTDAFSVLWPEGPRPHRVLRSCIDAAGAAASDVVGEMETPAGPLPIPRFAVVPPLASCAGDVEAMAMYAGESVAGIHRIEPAADVLARLVAEADACLRHAEGMPA